MKCQLNSNTTHDVLISKEISFKEICSGEPKKVNLGWNEEDNWMYVENNALVPISRKPIDFIYGFNTFLAYNWEVLSMFFSIHNIEPNWLYCNQTWGWYDEDLGGWTGCMGKV